VQPSGLLFAACPCSMRGVSSSCASEVLPKAAFLLHHLTYSLSCLGSDS
jgi:hypothetical protein